MYRRIDLSLPRKEVKREPKDEPEFQDVVVPERWNQTKDLSPIPHRRLDDEFADVSHEELQFEDAEDGTEAGEGEEPMDVDISEQAAATPLPITPQRPRSAQQREHDELLQQRVENAALILRQAEARADRASRRAHSADQKDQH